MWLKVLTGVKNLPKELENIGFCTKLIVNIILQSREYQHGRFYTIKSSVRKNVAKFVHIVKKLHHFEEGQRPGISVLVPKYINYDKSVLIDYGNRSPKYNRPFWRDSSGDHQNTIW